MKQKEAQEKNAKWAALTPTQQLAYLNERNFAAKRQRARLAGNAIVAEENKTTKEARAIEAKLHTEAKNARREAGKGAK
jgi:hypothetical protein